MYALIYKLNEVILKECSLDDIDNIKHDDIIEAHVFDNEQDIYIDKNGNELHLEIKEKDNDKTLIYDEKMFISKVFKSLYKSNYNIIVVRNYLDYNEDGILYVSSSRLVEVK